MTKPHAHHQRRANRAVANASILVGYECARHYNDPDIAIWGEGVDAKFDALTDSEVDDAGNALVAILRLQIGRGHADTLVASLPAGDMRAVAELVAYTIESRCGPAKLRVNRRSSGGIADGLENDGDPQR